MRQPSRNENASSPGQTAVSFESGREMSNRRSGDGLMMVRQPLVGARDKEVYKHVDRPAALGERCIQRRRGQAQEIGRAEVGDHSARPQGARETTDLGVAERQVAAAAMVLPWRDDADSKPPQSSLDRM